MNNSELDNIINKIYDLANNSDESSALVGGENEELNGIVDAVNYLEGKIRKEKKTTVMLNSFRLMDMQEVLNSYLSRDFSPKAKMSGKKDEIDALALSVNYFGQEMRESFAQIEKQQRDLEEFNSNLEKKVKARTIELEKAQKEIERSLIKEQELGKLKSRFVATASHQFRTPLAVIQSSMGLLNMQNNRMDNEFNSVFDKAHKRITRQIENMTLLMDEVLILEKINAGNLTQNIESIDLVSLCTEISTNYNEIQIDGREIDVNVTGNSIRIDLEREQIKHAISNLISNAFKYSKGRPSPSLLIDFNETKIQITIKDYGVGVPKNEMKHLFEPFYRGSNVQKISGSGLGTAIAKEYIEINKGTLDVESEENVGTRLIITFEKQ